MLGTQERTVRGGDAKTVAAVVTGIVGLGGVGAGAYLMGKRSCGPGGAGGTSVDLKCAQSSLDSMELECVRQLLNAGTLQVEMKNGLSARACHDALASEAHDGLWPYNKQAIDVACRLGYNLDDTDEATVKRGSETAQVSHLKFPAYRCDSVKEEEDQSGWNIDGSLVRSARDCLLGAYEPKTKKFSDKCTRQIQSGTVHESCTQFKVSALLQYRDEYIADRASTVSEFLVKSPSN
jgi:hypothetical protein